MNAYAYKAENYGLRSQTESEKTEYLYDTLGNRLMMTSDTKGDVVKYIYGIGLIGKESEEGYSEYHYDLRGSTTEITDSTGNITDFYYFTF